MKTYRISLALSLAIYSALTHAAPPATSAYSTDPQSSSVDDVTSEGIRQVNRLTCILAATRAEALVNQGNYTALIDESKCDTEVGAAASDTEEGNAAHFLSAVVDASRASNEAPMISKVWIDEDEEGGYKGIDVHVSAAEAPSIANPYGVFRLDFCGLYQVGPSCVSEGYLQGADDGIRYFQWKQRESTNGMLSQTVALRLNASGTTAGSGRMHVKGSDDGRSFDMDFDFAYNPTLFRRATSNSDECFSRDATDPAAGISGYRYGLYDATSGARVTRDSGFVFEYDVGGSTYFGYLGYYGLSTSSPWLAYLDSGSTVRKIDSVDGQAPVSTPYTFVKADGKLTKSTRQVRTLRSIDKIRFTSSFSYAEAQQLPGGFVSPTAVYEQYWDEAAGVFKVTAMGMCRGSEGLSSRVGGWHFNCQPIGSEQAVPLSFYLNRGGVLGWSQFLDAELSISLQSVTTPLDPAAVTVTYHTQDLVYPSELPANLFCLRDCPTAATLSSYFTSRTATSPFVAASINNVSATPADNVVKYHTDSGSALLIDAADQSVTYTRGSAGPPESGWGVRSGRLFPTLAAAKCVDDADSYCESTVDDMEIYYQWATGPASANQFVGVQDGNGEFVRFEAPLRVTFDVPSAATYGEYAGRSIELLYSGFGPLSGMPTVCISRLTNEKEPGCANPNTYPAPAFAIPFDATLGRVTSGENTYLVKWLKRGVRFARKDASVCRAAGLDLPAGVVLPSREDLRNPAAPWSDIYIGTKPAVDEPPRVINGEVQY